MTFWTASSGLAVVGCFAILLTVVSRMLLRQRSKRKDACEDEARLEFSIENYRPMERLLADEDLAFLTSQPGFRKEMAQEWKRERRRIFRLYFTELKSDFHRLHAEARRVVADADADAADLVSVLMHQRWVFLRATTSLEVRLILSQWGIGSVDAAPLLQLLDAMRADLVRHGLPQAA